MTYRIVTLPGDGIGPEVLAHGLQILRKVAALEGFEVEVEEIPCGGLYYLEHGRDWPEGAGEKCRAADLVLLGAVGWPSPDGSGPVTMANGKMAGYSPVIGNRNDLDLYANVRPVKLYPGVRTQIHGVPTAVWQPEKVDMVFVRENTEGLYAGGGTIHAPGGRAEAATDLRLLTRKGCERVLRFAFQLCRERGRGAPADGQKRLSCIVKNNVLKGCQMLVDLCGEIAQEFPEIQVEYPLIDSFTLRLMMEPEHFDVLVTTNLFGDIVTDLAAVLQGGMGMASSGNIGDHHGMFEPVHGSSPPLAGTDRANPIATHLSIAQGLQWLGHKAQDTRCLQAGQKIERAVATVLRQGEHLPQDLAEPGKGVSGLRVTEALLEQLESF